MFLKFSTGGVWNSNGIAHGRRGGGLKFAVCIHRKCRNAIKELFCFQNGFKSWKSQLGIKKNLLLRRVLFHLKFCPDLKVVFGQNPVHGVKFGGKITLNSYFEVFFCKKLWRVNEKLLFLMCVQCKLNDPLPSLYGFKYKRIFNGAYTVIWHLLQAVVC